MELIFEIAKFVFYVGLIVWISKNVLVKTLRNLAENLKLKPKTVGDVAGIATSIPELLTISVSSIHGFASASIYNVLSSNIINLIQYGATIIINKNQKTLKNKAIKTDIFLVLITIILPALFLAIKTDFQIAVVPVFILLYFGFKKINDNAHKLYLKNEDRKIEQTLEKEDRWERGNKSKVIKNVVILIIVGILLFVIGNFLGDTIESLCTKFGIQEFVVGIILGFTTSLPELITFLESQKHYKKGSNEILGVVEATNNLLMSNILNLFIIQSIGILLFYFATNI